MSNIPLPYLYFGLLLVVMMLLLHSVWRKPYTSVGDYCILSGIGGFFTILFALPYSHYLVPHARGAGSLVFHSLAWIGSFFLIVSALLLYRKNKKSGGRQGDKQGGKQGWYFPTCLLTFGLLYCGVFIYALLIEPTNLVVREMTIRTSKITQPLTIAFCSDMQTDKVGKYERRTMQKLKEQNADIILFGGDYIQGDDEEHNQQLIKDWNTLFREIKLQAPLGIYAVQGNKEQGIANWEEMFDGTAISPKSQTISESFGEIRITFLSLPGSSAKYTFIDREHNEEFRIIVGHRPLFAMAEQNADLLLAGHTHGGQVQIPFWGPIATNSEDLPRRWASGKTILPNGTTLIVSHGTGLTRGVAPRIRFWCRPDFWVLRLVPDEKLDNKNNNIAYFDLLWTQTAQARRFFACSF